MKLKPIFENNDLIVIDKAIDTVVVAAPGLPDECTLLPRVRAQYGRHIQPIHRLDRFTSGLLIFARNKEAQKRLEFAFKKHHVEKHYLAVCEGVPRWKKLQVEHALRRVKVKGRYRSECVKRSEYPDAKSAVTYFKVIPTLRINHDHTLPPSQKISILWAMPKTGRLHQIRVHAASVGHPLVNDIYSPQEGSDQPFCLHAVGLRIKDAGKTLRLVSLDIPSHWSSMQIKTESLHDALRRVEQGVMRA